MAITTPKKIVVYVMPDKRGPVGHPFLVACDTVKNHRTGKYALRGIFAKIGLFHGPAKSAPAASRRKLAELVGETILAQAGL
jgi:hypothetical protein